MSFRVLAGSAWRRATLDESQVSYKHQLRVDRIQRELLAAGVLDEITMTFAADYVFDNWRQAVIVVSGKSQYSGSYHWQLLS